jgi:hypothetical protein
MVACYRPRSEPGPPDYKIGMLTGVEETGCRIVAVASRPPRLTPWTRIIFEKPIITSLIKEFTLYGNRKQIRLMSSQQSILGYTISQVDPVTPSGHILQNLFQ